MSRVFNFIWIDDDPTRKSISDSLEDRVGAKIKFIPVNGKNVQQLLTEVISSSEPDLLIFDHSLDKANAGSFRTGFTCAAFIRENWPSCPIVCITAISKDIHDYEQHSLYQETFEIKDIAQHDQDILSLAEGFDWLKNVEIDSVESVLTALGAPDDDHYRISAILPSDLKSDSKDKSFHVILYKWIRWTLFERPGFLYDTLWMATMLGLNEKGFAKVSEVFEPARYKGLFQNGSKPRWWRSTALSIIFDTVGKNGLPWVLGRELKGISQEDFSVDYVEETLTPIPETVAYVDESETALRKPMRIRNTIPHPKFEDLLHFETIRLMKPHADD